MTETLSQDQIDRLIGNIGDSEIISLDPIKENSDEIKKKYRSVQNAVHRYDYALRNGSFEEIREARKYLHHEAHTLWLVNHGFVTRADFKHYIKCLLKNKRN